MSEPSGRREAQALRRAADELHLREHEPGLRLVVHAEGPALRVEGTVAVQRSDGRVVPFAVSIRYPGMDPLALPDAYDDGERFPPDPDRHIENTGRFCLWLPPLAPSTRFAQLDGLAFFLEKVREFLSLQLVYERRRQRGTQPHWSGAEWGHGGAGYDQWVREVLGDLGVGALENVLDQVGRAPRPRGRPCVCGSGRRYGACHLTGVDALRAAWGDREVKAACERLRRSVRADVRLGK